jgi:phospho-N-acetylmuramoyl-pentapeptide-transferase
MTLLAFNAIKVLFALITAFLFGIAMTPRLTKFMYDHKLWRTASRSQDNTEAVSEAFKKVHNEKGERSTPRVGGVIIWLSVTSVIVVLQVIAIAFPGEISRKLDFLSSNQTRLPIAALLVASFIGLADDLLQIFGKKLSSASDGISRKLRILLILLIGACGAWWFYFKLQTQHIHVPFVGDLYLGPYFILFFIIVVLGTFTTSVIDGIDGLAAGVIAPAFGAYAIIAFSQQQIDIAAFCGAMIGGILSFLWFNIPPARFYLGETGMMGLTVSLAIVAFLTKEVLVLPIIALPLVITALSSFIQMNSKKYFKKKVFIIAPLHHHFEALGWSRAKITMRYWVISVICATIGTVIALVA